MKYAQTQEEMLLSLINRNTPQAVLLNCNACSYEHKYNGGCAIGCQVSKSTAIKIEQKGGNVGGIFDLLPKRMKDMKRAFLQDIQYIHDSDTSWINYITAEKAKDGLVWSNGGRKRINKIIKKYNLVLEPLDLINK